MEDGEGGEDESMQEGTEEGRTPLFRKKREPALEPGSAGAHEDSHPLPLLVRSLRQRKGRRGPRDHPHFAIDYGFLKANNTDDPADQGSNPILIGAEAKYGLTLAMAVPGKGNAALWIAKRVADWLDSLGSQTVTL